MNAQPWVLVTMCAVIIWYLSTQAGRLDRLHHRIDVAQAALDTQLVRRAGIVAELANTEAFDLVTSVILAQSAHDALASNDIIDDERLQTETDLTEILVATFDEPADFPSDNPVLDNQIDELAQVCRRLVMSHQFHTNAVTDCLNIRQQLLVRALFLAGRAPMPHVLNFRDDLPRSFVK